MVARCSTLHTDRLVLRPWRDEDIEAFSALNADPKVMAFYPSVLSRDESVLRLAHMTRHFEEHGFGMWVVETGGRFVGLVGLAVPDFSARFTPCVEVGWRLAAEHWGRGYATEAARAAVMFGFNHLDLEEIVSFTTATNQRSRRVMEQLGMRRAPADDFLHPRLPEGHTLRPHVLYRLRRSEYRATR